MENGWIKYDPSQMWGLVLYHTKPCSSSVMHSSRGANVLALFRKIHLCFDFARLCITMPQELLNKTCVSPCTYESGHTSRMCCITISNSAKVNLIIKVIKNTISCVFKSSWANLAHELFVIPDFLSWWPRKVNPCIAVHPMNTKYGWIKHFHSSHYYLISCLTELSVWSNP